MNWDQFAQRCTQAAKKRLRNNKDGACIIVCTIVCDASGNPILWLEPEVSRVEPSSTASQALAGLLAQRID